MAGEMSTKGFAICISNEGYPASLEVRKVYRVLPDADAERHARLRVIDESGEDYLYPEEYFAPVEIPETAERVFEGAPEAGR